MSAVQRVSRTSMPRGDQGWPISWKNGNRLIDERQRSRWTLEPSLKAFITWLANWLGLRNQRICSPWPKRGSTAMNDSSPGSQA